MKMSPAMIIWWKEIRGILPVWLGTLAVFALSFMMGMLPFGMERNLWPMFSVVFGGAGIAVGVYARDFHDRTMLWQLVQPEGRMTLLARKVVVLTCALSSICVAVVVAVVLTMPVPVLVSGVAWQELGELLGLYLILPLTSVCLWSLLTRTLLATAVMTFVVPFVLWSMFVPLVRWLGWDYVLLPEALRDGALLIYSLLSGCGALALWRRLELRGETVAVSSFDIRWMERFVGDRAFKLRSAARALWRKELGVQRFIGWVALAAIVIAVLYLVASLLLDRLAADWIAKSWAATSNGITTPRDDGGPLAWRENLKLLGAVAAGFYIALIPALAGALAFAEETYFGTRASQLCQPTGLVPQWLIKLGAAMLVSVLAGVALPSLVALPLIHLAGVAPDGEAISQAVCIHFLLFGVAAWCASWSRATAPALLKALLLVAGFLMLQSTIAGWFHYGMFNWQTMAWPTASLAIALTYSNFKALEQPLRRWGWQLAALTAVAGLSGLLAGWLVDERFVILIV